LSKNIFYNVAKQDTSNGLKDFEVSSGQDYFILISAPANANVTVKLNSNTAPAIPIYEFWQFKSTDLEKLYISCDPVAGELIYGQADGNLEITTNPQIGSINSIAEIEDNFAPNNSLETTITNGSFYELDTSALNQVRFYSSDEVGVDINLNGVKYPMIEDLINLRNISNNIRFYNDSGADITLKLWSM